MCHAGNYACQHFVQTSVGAPRPPRHMKEIVVPHSGGAAVDLESSKTQAGALTRWNVHVTLFSSVSTSRWGQRRHRTNNASELYPLPGRILRHVEVFVSILQYHI